MTETAGTETKHGVLDGASHACVISSGRPKGIVYLIRLHFSKSAIDIYMHLLYGVSRVRRYVLLHIFLVLILFTNIFILMSGFNANYFD